MTSSNTRLKNVLLDFSKQYVAAFEKAYNHLPIIERDEAWISPCEKPKNEEENYWQPTALTDFLLPETIAAELNFENVESALELSLHPDIKTYFSTMFSEALEAHCADGELSLLFAWNMDDFVRLQENIIGHVLMKKRLKQPVTIFFAVTDEEDIIISLNNETGEIWAERVGCLPHKKLSDDLVSFLEQLSPLTK
ncbi:SecY-interacting protein [Litorilituus lipolyticus]|uniref:Protein Syd n=1 Tax=Litorilituus lipolyticus TaxID=2491017 RepID=A0A502KQG4_9GAMM|nr:SecY-interacting protein [Litorilituus lipolyticus]TPH12549.1 SecY-interacting protein [Litorilituus lipolyticus]